MSVENEQVKVSVIIPMRNVQNSIGGIISAIERDTADIRTEFILVDMNSTDNSLFTALKTVKDKKLEGFIVQSGSKTLGAALNTGIIKARGEYLTFIFPRRMYAPFISAYYETAAEFSSDFVFGKFPESGGAKPINFSTGTLSGLELFKGVLTDLITFDIATIMVSKKFLLDNNIMFYEDCGYGYAEEFIYRILLKSEKINQSSRVMHREPSMDAELGLPEEIGMDCFQRVEALLRIYELLEYRQRADKKLLAKFKYDKVPEAVMSCVNLLLREGYSIKTVKTTMKIKGYDDYLNASKSTDKKLKRSIRLWNTFPKLYKV